MDLEELKSRFEEQDRKLQTALRLNTRALEAPFLAKAETAARRLRRVLVFELVLNAATLVPVGSFLADHVREPRFALPAAMLHLGLIALLAVGARQLVALARVDYGAPVASIQRRLEALRAGRIRATAWTLLLAPLAWPPLFVVAAKAFLGLDAWVAPGPAWLLANLAFGAAVASGAFLLARRFAHRWSGFAGRLGRLLAGQSLADAERFAAEIDALERTET